MHHEQMNKFTITIFQPCDKPHVLFWHDGPGRIWVESRVFPARACFRSSIFHSTSYLSFLHQQSPPSLSVVDAVSSHLAKFFLASPSAIALVLGDFSIRTFTYPSRNDPPGKLHLNFVRTLPRMSDSHYNPHSSALLEF